MDHKTYTQLMKVFQTELEENLQLMTDCMLALEKDPGQKKSGEFIDSLFRAAHTIKGSAQSLGLAEVGEIAHQLETLFSKFKVGSVEINAKISNTVFSSMDRMKESMKKSINKPETPSVLSNDTIRVSLDKIDRISALGEELQGIKLRNDDLIDRLESILMQLGHDEELQASLSELWRGVRDNNVEFGLTITSQQENIRIMRLIPVSAMLQPMMRTVRDIAQRLEKEVNFSIRGEEIEVDRLVLENLKDPLVHLIRNAIDHGIEDSAARKASGKPIEGNINIKIREEGGRVLISVIDDGMGIDEERVKEVAVRKNMISHDDSKKLNHEDALNLIFMPGLSTKKIITELSGRGVGMDVVLHNVQKIKGTLSVKSEPNKGTTFTISVPLTLATDRGMLISVMGQIFIIPTTSIWRILNLTTKDIHSIEGKKVINVSDEVIALYSLAEILKLKSQEIEHNQQVTILILYLGASKVAFLVDSILNEREVAIKSLLPPLSKSPFISGATLSGRGEVILVLSPTDLIAATQKSKISGVEIKKEAKHQKTRILVVEDSITTRTLEVDILTSKGFDVKSAVNGMEAWGILQRELFDLIITDVSMPIMTGFELTEKIKREEKLKNIPVIIVTSLATENDKRKGVEVGADAYIVKNQFETKELLSLINDMVG